VHLEHLGLRVQLVRLDHRVVRELVVLQAVQVALGHQDLPAFRVLQGLQE
jgi:hypothetical protein